MSTEYWIRCNVCFSRPGSPNPLCFLTCNHLVCHGCLETGAAQLLCPVCNESVRSLTLGRDKLPPFVQAIFGKQSQLDEIVKFQADQRQIMMNNLEKKVEGLERMLVEKQQEVDQECRVNRKLQKVCDDQKKEINEMKSIISRQATVSKATPRSRQLSFPSGRLFPTSHKNPIPPGASLNLMGNQRKQKLRFGSMNTNVKNERGNLDFQSPSRDRGGRNDFAMDFKTPDWKR